MKRAVITKNENRQFVLEEANGLYSIVREELKDNQVIPVRLYVTRDMTGPDLIRFRVSLGKACEEINNGSN